MVKITDFGVYLSFYSHKSVPSSVPLLPLLPPLCLWPQPLTAPLTLLLLLSAACGSLLNK